MLGPSSLKDTEPLLGSLRNNGGITDTMQPLPGSPAVDGGDDGAAPNFDQRGFVRPAGVRSDIGAVEAGVPGIISQPASRTNSVGSSVSLTVTATGDAPLTYQWRFHGTNILDATSVVYAINNLTTNQAGPYRVVVSNSFGALTSAVATLTVTIPPTIATPPTNVTVFPGGNFTLSVTAAGVLPLAYQWRLNGNNLGGATASVYSRSNVQTGDSGLYTVVVTNTSGSVTSSTAVVKVLVPPVISQPSRTQTNFSLSFNSVAGVIYEVEYKNTLSAPTWTPLATNVGDGAALTYVIATTNPPARFYRVLAR